MSTSPERRRHARHTLDLPVTLVMVADPRATFEAEMRDLSAGGCFFRTAQAGGNFAKISLSFRRELRGPVVAGEVVRRVANQGFAVRFHDAGAEIERLVSALGALTPALRSDFVGGFLSPSIEVY